MNEGGKQMLPHRCLPKNHLIQIQFPSLRQATRIFQPPDRYGFSHTSLLATLSSIAIPNSYPRAVKHECWQQAMKEELDALQDNHTWEVVSCPQLSRLDVNGYSLSNSSLAAHWIDIKHILLLLAINRSRHQL
eukprot:TRINITY_DN21988_c0_g1_i1.p1 TRINITY_DN21988_c0_g1~~TRINITY_DN21988_c0_g1_i1.p1  ORF type:complete len:133 (+),score=15.09 TRINITY_DN21988_c0_g1_i1:299-697(+)